MTKTTENPYPLGPHISVWIHKNDAIELPLYNALSGRFLFSPETISKGDDIKIKGKSVLYSFFCTAFIFPSLPSFLHVLPFTWLGGGLKI